MADFDNFKNSAYNPQKYGFWKNAQNQEVAPSNYYFADTIRSYIICFGDFFKDIHVIRHDEDGKMAKIIEVPIKYGPRSKAHDYRTEQESGNTYIIQQPNITYSISQLSWDSERQTSPGVARDWYSSKMPEVPYHLQEMFWKDTMPIPYNFQFDLVASCDKFTDAAQIMEQIARKFYPENFLYVKEFWFFDITRDIKIVMDSINIDYDGLEFGEEQKREVFVKASFKLEGFIYNKIADGVIIDQIKMYMNSHTRERNVSATSATSELTYVGISGNYKIDPKTQETSMRDRFNLDKWNGEIHEKEFLDADNNILTGKYVTEMKYSIPPQNDIDTIYK